MNYEEQVRLLAELLRQMVIVGMFAPPKELEFGPPCANLEEVIMAKGAEALAQELLGNRPEEFRLKGPNLTLFLRFYEDRLVLHVSAMNPFYRVTVNRLTRLIGLYGFSRIRAVAEGHKGIPL